MSGIDFYEPVNKAVETHDGEDEKKAEEKKAEEEKKRKINAEREKMEKIQSEMEQNTQQMDMFRN